MTVPKKRVLLFGPIGDFGGRELESGFIASVLSRCNEVTICSTVTITRKSQVFDFVDHLTVFSINEILLKKFFVLNVLALFSFFKNKCKGKVSDYVSNRFAKKKIRYEDKVISVLENIVNDCDIVFIIGQLSSSLVDKAVIIAKNKNKKVIFRTTGTITFYDYEYLDSVDCFIHHSQKNAKQLENNRKHKYEIIDQCAYNEDSLLKIKGVDKTISKFLILSRLSPEKGIEEIIDFFLRICSENDILLIAGNGALESNFKIKYEQSTNVRFLGFVSSSNLTDLFEVIDCLIIPSPEESGPLVGIESMCAGKTIISTRVGAMEERMHDTLNDFWFDYNDFESFKATFFRVKGLSQLQVEKNAERLKTKYKREYSINKIGDKYLNIVDEILNLCN